MGWYKTGTASVTSGSNAVIGTGTSFIANSRVGDAFRGPDGEWYEVTNIASDTAMSIAPNYQGATVVAGGYSLAPMQGYVKDSADALRAATQVIASGVADMQEQVAVATEAAASAGQSNTAATEQAGIASSAAQTSNENKDAAQQAAQQSGTSAQASGTAADRAEAAKTSIIQSEQAAAASATAAAESAAHAEEVTLGKAASGDNNDITSLRALSSDGFDRIRQGLAPMVGATASAVGTKGLVPVASIADRLKVLSGAGVWVELPTGAAWGSITGALSTQTDLKAAFDSRDSQISALQAKSVKRWRSTNLSLSSTPTSFAHTLGVAVDTLTVYVTLTTSVGGWAVGTTFRLGGQVDATSGSGYYGIQVSSVSSASFNVVVASSSAFLAIITTAGALATLALSQCTIQVELLSWQ